MTSTFLSIKCEPQKIELVKPLRMLYRQLRGGPGLKLKIEKIRKTIQFKILISNKGGEVNKEYAIDKPAVFTASASVTYLGSPPFSSLATSC